MINRFLRAFLALCLLVLLALGAWWYFLRPTAPALAWDGRDGIKGFEFPLDKLARGSIDVSPDGSLFTGFGALIGQEARHQHIFSMETGAVIHTLEDTQGQAYRSLSLFSPTGTHMAADGGLYAVETGTLIADISPYASSRSAVAWTRDGTALVVADGTQATFIDVESGAVRNTLTTTGETLSVAPTSDGPRVAFVREEGRAENGADTGGFLTYTSGPGFFLQVALPDDFAADTDPGSLSWSRDGQFVGLVSQNGRDTFVYSLATKEGRVYAGGDDVSYSAGFFYTQDHLLLSTYDDEFLGVWTLGAENWTTPCGIDADDLALPMMARTGPLLALSYETYGDDTPKAPQICNLETGQTHTLDALGPNSTIITWSVDGQSLIVANEDAQVSLWRVAD